PDFDRFRVSGSSSTHGHEPRSYKRSRSVKASASHEGKTVEVGRNGRRLWGNKPLRKQWLSGATARRRPANSWLAGLLTGLACLGGLFFDRSKLLRLELFSLHERQHVRIMLLDMTNRRPHVLRKYVNRYA